MEKKAYWINQHNSVCVLCGHKIGGCHLGDYCTNPECPYVDGKATLTEEEAKKFKKFII
jgi:hypothetical protein